MESGTTISYTQNKHFEGKKNGDGNGENGALLELKGDGGRKK